MVGFFFEMLENIVGKGENAGYQHFLLFPQCFSEGFLPRVVIVRGLTSCFSEGYSDWLSLQVRGIPIINLFYSNSIEFTLLCTNFKTKSYLKM